MSQSDVQAAFYRIALPPGLDEFFVLPSVPTRRIPGLSEEERKAFGEVVSPCMSTLPMGWSWALFFCQAAVSAGMQAAGAAPDEALLDRGPAHVMREGSVRHAVYVDNFSAFLPTPMRLYP